MNRKSKNINDGLKQTDMFSCLNSLKRLRRKQQTMKKVQSEKITSPHVIIVEDSDDDSQEKRAPSVRAKRKLPFSMIDDVDFADENHGSLPQTQICLNKPNMVSTPTKNLIVDDSSQQFSPDLIPSNTYQNDGLQLSSISSRRLDTSESSCSTIKLNLPDNRIKTCASDYNYNSNTTKLDETPKKCLNSFFQSVTQNVTDKSLKLAVSTTDSNTQASKGKPSITGNSKKAKTSTSSSPKSSTTPFSRKGDSPIKKDSGMNRHFLNIINNLISAVCSSRYLTGVLGEDKMILNVVKDCSPDYQYVCFKLYTRMPRWHNLSQFCNSHQLNFSNGEVVELFEFLKNNDIVETDYKEEDLQTLLNLLPSSDIQSIGARFRLKKKTKTEMIKILLNNCTKQSTLTTLKSTKDLVLEEVINKFGNCVVKIKENFQKAFYHMYVLGTFTNPMFYDKNAFLRNMIEMKIDFPDYTVQDYIVFYSRTEFLSYAKACEYRDKLDQLTTSRSCLEMLQMGTDVYNNLKLIEHEENDARYEEAPHLKRYTARSVYATVLTNISNAIRVKHSVNVILWLEYLIENFPTSHRLGDWYFDLCGIYMNNLKNLQKAADLIIEALNQKRSYLTEYQIQNLGERGHQLKNKCGSLLQNEVLPEPIHLDHFPQAIVDAKTLRNNQSGKKRHYEVQSSDGSKTYKSVEQVAMDNYIDKCGYTDGEHCEGSIVMATFVLFFWDIIYRPEIAVPGTFISDLQQYPLDMYTTYFYTNRKSLIDKRLEDIAADWSDQELVHFATNNWVAYSQKSGLCVVDNIIKNENMLKVVVPCIGRQVLSKIFKRLITDVRQYRSGMPDLLVWNEVEQKAKFVEVKGEHDKLSVKQKLWLKYLQSIGADIEVCHVHSIGSKKLKLLSREDDKNLNETVESSNPANIVNNKNATSKSKPKIVKNMDNINNFSDSDFDFSDSVTTLTKLASNTETLKSEGRSTIRKRKKSTTLNESSDKKTKGNARTVKR